MPHPDFYVELAKLVDYSVMEDETVFVKVVSQSSSNDGFTVDFYKWDNEDHTMVRVDRDDLPSEAREQLVVE